MTDMKGVNENNGIAIVGVGLRFPGAESLTGFWSQLADERCVVGDLPAVRRDSDESFSAPGGEANRVRGGFLADADAFDASFFGISPREAMYMDPQQRFALELAWKAVEDAGYQASALQGSRTGVFMGVANTDYTELLEKQGDAFDACVPTGTSSAIIANRVSYWFDFRGPSLTVDTACASSLVAVHQAVRALERGDCDQALAGGVNLCWSGRRFTALRRNGMLSENGLCKAFDASADGYVRAEGGAVIMLKPLATALAAGDAIHAVIKGIGTNHGGRTNSLTITNPQAHADLICSVYAEADVAASSISYIETHGPGTPLGDPIEIHGLKTAFSRLTEHEEVPAKPSSCGLGSVKTNLGHLESAAGIAGMLKVIAAMRHRTLPATLHFDQLNPLIRLDDSPFYIVERTQPWQPGKGGDGEPHPLRAGVSSFGFGGSNAHVLLEAYEPQAYQAQAGKGEQADYAEPATDAALDEAADVLRLVPLSAKDSEQLRLMARNLLDDLRGSEEGGRASASQDRTGPGGLRDIAYTLQVGREAMTHRAVFLAAGHSDLVAQLDAFAHDRQAPDVRLGVVGQDQRLSLLAGDEDATAMFRSWIEKRKLAKVAELWTLGCDIDWNLLYVDETPRRLHLPTYPFMRRKYWIPGSSVEGERTLPSSDTSTASSERPEPRPSKTVVAGIPATVGTALQSPAAVVSAPKRGFIAEKPRAIPLRELSEAGLDGAKDQSRDVSRLTPGETPAAVPTSWRIRKVAPAPDRADRAELERQLVQSLAEVLYLEPAEVDVDQRFIDIGLDSVIAVEWIRAVNDRFGADLSASHVYDFPSVRALAGELVGVRDSLTGAVEAPEAVPGPADEAVLDTTVRHTAPDTASLETALTESLAEALFMAKADVAVDGKFVDIGLDSIIAVEWMNTVNTRYGTSLPVAAVYEYPTIREFAVHLAQRSNGRKPGAAESSDFDIDHVLRQVQSGSLDLEQAERMLQL
ncbi:type I polyketide synthase [Streptomyces hyaluromycini]|uniref:type I polyketide synthase n=1 Tax=Streptomyces hyaluromycini TaxID=1377993 RepID=UPI000B5C5FC4|nr:beta-ketoacyl synthase N-terminal-like domain-containing protein [Streptomyces hyaluromycini]